jgi:hypothetical protein
LVLLLHKIKLTMSNGVVRLNKSSISGGGGGGVTSVTGTAPVESSGGATPAISMPVSTTSANGYLSSGNWNNFNRKFGGFIYNQANGTYLDVPSSGGAILTLADSELYEVRISYTTADGITGLNSYFLNGGNGFGVGGNAIIITNSIGQTAILLGVGYAVDNGTYCTIPVSGYFGSDPLDFQLTTTRWTFTQNPQLALINNTSLYGNTNFTTSYAMAGNLNNVKIGIGIVFIGIGSPSSNANEVNRSVTVATGIVTYLYLRITTTMTGTMIVRLHKNGGATSMTFTIPAGSAAGKYTTVANQQSVVDGDELAISIQQSTMVSANVVSFGFIIT